MRYSKLPDRSSVPVNFKGPDNDHPFAIPADWTWTRLDDLAPKYQNGTSSRGDPAGEPTIVLRLADIKDGCISLDSPRHLLLQPGVTEKYRVAPGEILIIRVNGSSDLVGRFIVSDLSDDVAYCDHFIRMQLPDGRVLPSFLRWLGDSDFLRKQITSLFVTSAGQKTVNQRHIGALLFPLPPLAEQLRIVEKIDELMALCGEMRATQEEREFRRGTLRTAVLQQLIISDPDEASTRENARFFLNQSSRLITKPEHIAMIRQTILDLAVQGRLVTQDSGSSPEPSYNGGHETLPCGWTPMALGGMLAEESRNGYSRKPDGAVDGVPILRISAGTVRADLLVAEEEYKLIGQVSAYERDQYSLRPGDLVACRFNGNRSFVGRISLFTGYLHQAPLYPDKLIRLRVRKEIALPALIRWFAASCFIRSEISELCATTVGNWGISATNLKSVPFPLPPMEEQHRIVTKIEELMAVCDELESTLASAQMRRGLLLEALLHDALAVGAGQLTSAGITESVPRD